MSASSNLLVLACAAVRSVRVTRAGAGDRAAVTGTGPLAELAVRALTAVGISDVRRVTTVDDRIDAGVVVETTGDPAVILAILEHGARDARIALAGDGAGRTIDVDFYRTVHHRGLEVSGIATAGDPTIDPDRDAATALLDGHEGSGRPAA